VQQSVAVPLGCEETVVLTLPNAGQTSSVSVSGEPLVLNTDNPNMTTTFSAAAIERVPNRGGDITFPVQLAAITLLQTGCRGVACWAWAVAGKFGQPNCKCRSEQEMPRANSLQSGVKESAQSRAVFNTLTIGAALVAAMGVNTPISAQRRMPLGRGGPQGRSRVPISASAARIQRRTYLFEETNKKIEYDVFVSARVDKRNKSPLVLALHGLGVPPGDPASLSHDDADISGYVVAAPMGYSLEGWYRVTGRIPPNAKPPNFGELSEKDVMNVLDLTRREFNIDDHRIYLVGQSMGGAGALYLGAKYHQIWAAVGASAPAAATLSPTILEMATDLPMILIQGDEDDRVPVEPTRVWADEMRDLKMTYEYDELPGVGHRDAIIRGSRRVFAFFDKYSKAGANN
jgi:poly(3-hydroxybutyrate) depolymerase